MLKPVNSIILGVCTRNVSSNDSDWDDIQCGEVRAMWEEWKLVSVLWQRTKLENVLHNMLMNIQEW